MKHLREDIRELSSLLQPSLMNVDFWKDFHKVFEILYVLKNLNMCNNVKFMMFQKNFGGLQCLITLNLEVCAILEEKLPLTFEHLGSFKSLHMQKTLLKKLPHLKKNLRTLEILEMQQCPNLADVQALPTSL